MASKSRPGPSPSPTPELQAVPLAGTGNMGQWTAVPQVPKVRGMMSQASLGCRLAGETFPRVRFCGCLECQAATSRLPTASEAELRKTFVPIARSSTFKNTTSKRKNRPILLPIQPQIPSRCLGSASPLSRSSRRLCVRGPIDEEGPSWPLFADNSRSEADGSLLRCRYVELSLASLLCFPEREEPERERAESIGPTGREEKLTLCAQVSSLPMA